MLLTLPAYPAAEAQPPPAPLLLSAAFPAGYADAEADEALQLWNVSGSGLDLGGWSVEAGGGRASFPPGSRLAAGDRIWLAREPAAFRRAFGADPDWIWGDAAGSAITLPRMASLAGGPRMADGMGQASLRDAKDRLVDRLVYASDGATVAEPASGWSGPPASPYALAGQGLGFQVFWRKLDPARVRPLPDTDRAADWASDPDDPLRGRRPRHPGWRLEDRLRPIAVRERATVEIAVAPDGLFDFLLGHVERARERVDLVSYGFDQPELAELLAGKARTGLRVRIWLEGRPVGGVGMLQRWCLARIVEAGGQVHWMDQGGSVAPRFPSLHAKLIRIDDRWLLLGTENPGPASAPHIPAEGAGIAGRRGFYLATDAPSVLAWAGALIDQDLDPLRYRDVRPYQARDPKRGAPAADYGPEDNDRGLAGAYQPRWTEPFRARGLMGFELIRAPENALEADRGILGLIGRAGMGDSLLVAQLHEPPYWGAAHAGDEPGREPPNLRVEAYLAAARRGASVRLLLDGHFDPRPDGRPGANRLSATRLNGIARQEGLDLAVRLGNPTGLGLHSKLIMVANGDSHYVHIGSINGSEVSSKANLEAGITLDSSKLYAKLAQVFAWDWYDAAAGARYLPSLNLSW